MKTNHTLIIGDCSDMKEIKDGSVHLVVTSPPYFNAPFDYKKLEMLQKVAKELFRVVVIMKITAKIIIIR